VTRSMNSKERWYILDPCRLAIGRLARTGTAVVGAILLVLRGGGQVVDHVPSVPDLVGATTGTRPDLNLRPARSSGTMQA
jgi:hypothetical protein